MYNQQIQGNPLLQAREYSQPAAGGGDVGSNGEKKGVRFSEYQGMPQVPQQPVTYTGIQEPMDDYNLHQYVSQNYPYSMVYDNRILYNKPQATYIPQLNQEKQVNGKINGVQYYDPKAYSPADVNVNHLAYYPAYSNPQQISAYPSMMPALPYSNNNLLLQQQAALQYPVQATSIKRDYPGYGTTDKNQKKQQITSKPPMNRVTTPQPYSLYQNYPAVSNQYIQQRPMPSEYPSVYQNIKPLQDPSASR